METKLNGHTTPDTTMTNPTNTPQITITADSSRGLLILDHTTDQTSEYWWDEIKEGNWIADLAFRGIEDTPIFVDEDYIKAAGLSVRTIRKGLREALITGRD